MTNFYYQKSKNFKFIGKYIKKKLQIRIKSGETLGILFVNKSLQDKIKDNS